MNCMQFSETDQQVKLEFKDVSYFSSGEGSTPDHSKLINRDAADQHPMSAITGLVDALAGKQPTGDYLTKEQDPTVPSWAKQPQKPAYTAQEVGALPDTTPIPTALSELSEDATHRVVTDAEKAAWNAKSNFTGSYNDLTDKPVIPAVPVQSVNGKIGAVVLSADDVGALPASTVIPSPYTLPIASSTVLGGVQPVAKTDDMTQSVGVDEAGALWAVPGGSGGGSSGGYIDTIIAEIEITEEVSTYHTSTLTSEQVKALTNADIIYFCANLAKPSEQTSRGNLLASIYGSYYHPTKFFYNDASYTNVTPSSNAYGGDIAESIAVKNEAGGNYFQTIRWKSTDNQYGGEVVATARTPIAVPPNSVFNLSTNTVFGVGTTAKLIARRFI